MERGIYRIYNILNLKTYIGSSINIKRRFTTHKYHLNKNGHHCEHLQRAWNKYGKEYFKFEILEILNDNIDLEKEEQKWLDDAKYELYNSCKIAGNKSGFSHSEETKNKIGNSNKNKVCSVDTREKISQTLKGRKLSEEVKKKMSDSQRGKQKIFTEKQRKACIERLKPYMTGQKIGFKHTEKSKLLISESKKGYKQSQKTKDKRALSLNKKIKQYDKDMNFIKEWNSIKEAGETLSIRRCFISSVLTGVKKSAKGFIFKYT